MAVIKSWLHLVPPGNIAHELDLIGKREDVHVGSDIDVQHMEFIGLAQIVCYVNKAGGSRFRYAIVKHHQVLLEVKVIGGGRGMLIWAQGIAQLGKRLEGCTK